MPADIAIHVKENLVRRWSDPSVHGNVRALVRHSPYERLKAAIDFLGALILLLPATVITLVAGLAVKCSSPGPMFYSQTRLGRFGQRFRILKLRTMRHDCECQSGACWAKVNDVRITRVGRLLRKFHIDELPQLWNVLCGHLSLVGPRPERPEFTPALGAAFTGYNHRLLVKPGLTGLAQVRLPPDTDLESVRRKLRYDLYYMRNLGLRLDIRIILATILYLWRVPSGVACRWMWVPGPSVVEPSTDAEPRRVPLTPHPIPAPHVLTHPQQVA